MTREPIGRHERPWAAHTDADREQIKAQAAAKVRSFWVQSERYEGRCRP